MYYVLKTKCLYQQFISLEFIEKIFTFHKPINKLFTMYTTTYIINCSLKMKMIFKKLKPWQK